MARPYFTYELLEKLALDGFNNIWPVVLAEWTQEQIAEFLGYFGSTEIPEAIGYSMQLTIGYALVAREKLENVQLRFPRGDSSFMIAAYGQLEGIVAFNATIAHTMWAAKQLLQYSPVCQLFHQVDGTDYSAWEYFGCTFSASETELHALEQHAKLIANICGKRLEDV